MKTITTEKEILQVYNSYWHHYLAGDVKGMQSLLADDYTQVGSAEGEVFSNRMQCNSCMIRLNRWQEN